MRTTVTLDPDVAVRLKRRMKELDVTFKEAINEALRRGLDGGSEPSRPYRVAPRGLAARPGVDLTHALRLAGEIEDRETARELDLRK